MNSPRAGTGKEGGPRKCSVPESREARFRKEGTASRVGPCLGIKKGNEEGSLGLAVRKSVSFRECS